MARARHPSLLSILLAAALLAGGCEVKNVGSPPVSLGQYRRMREGDANSYPPRTVALHNLQRALDAKLGESERIDSLNLLAHLGEQVPEARGQLGAVLTDPTASPALQGAAMGVLLTWNEPGLAAYVVKLLPTLSADDPMREQVLGWLAANPTPETLASVVKMWAAEPSITSVDEPRYRQIVERLAGRKWDEALLAAINSPRPFYARGSAMQILAARIRHVELRRRVLAMTPTSDAVAAAGAFVNTFGYLPTNGRTMLQCVWLHKTRPEAFADVAALARQWQQDYGYRFGVRDFHLLSRLAKDPLRRNIRRREIVLDLAPKLLRRRHVPCRTASRAALGDRFSRHVDRLSMADLWRLRLLGQMLAQPDIQQALYKMSRRDRADRGSAWGGLVFYAAGQADPQLYPPQYEAAGGDLVYSPTLEARRAGLDALCWFRGHFEKAENARRAGPTEEELSEAKWGNYCGLVLAGVSDEACSAHFYNPDGIVISLGVYPLSAAG